MPRTRQHAATQVQQEAGPSPNAFVEHEWMARHPRALRAYVGEYVAVCGEQVVAHGKHGGRVIAEARKRAPRHVLAYIPEGDEDMVL